MLQLLQLLPSEFLRVYVLLLLLQSYLGVLMWGRMLGR